jgi:hypothetical protein
MEPRRALIRFILTIIISLLACVLLACGGNTRTLQSVSVTPATAVGQAQFMATGIYSTMPTSVNITSTTTWCVAYSTGVCDTEAQLGVQVNAGLAQCQSWGSGTFTILAGQPGAEPGVNAPFPLKPYGTAQITCP